MRKNKLDWLLPPNLKTKFILSLLVVSLASMAAVGWFANYLLMQKFNDLYAQDASKHFANGVARYIETYGSWQAGQKHETFREFSERTAPRGQRPPDAPRPPDTLSLPMGDASPPSLHPPEGSAQAVAQGSTRPYVSNLQRPPFRFYLFDTQYHALSKLPPYEKGDAIKAEHRAALQPILLKEKTVAYYVPQGQASYSDLDLGYQAAVHRALRTGIIVAGVLALLLGWLFGGRLSKRLNTLTQAVEAMQEGELKQQVHLEGGRDELNTLADAFNQMSDRVASGNQALRQSHAQIEKQAEQLRELSVRDALTQLYNRRYFDKQGEYLFNQAARYQRPFSVMIGDIDFFKKINDGYSHAVGDEVLRRVGDILATKVRSSDLVARYGGEEFVIAFPETNLTQAQATCEALRQRIESYPWHEIEPNLKVTMSMGVSADNQAENIHKMLQAADALLYKAKSGGRNQVCSA